jgi:hypothetical protein
MSAPKGVNEEAQPGVLECPPIFGPSEARLEVPVVDNNNMLFNELRVGSGYRETRPDG